MVINVVNGLRFIIGSGCNYDCFFCHHEGYEKLSYDEVSKEKLGLLEEFCEKNGIRDISITGGEPFVYWNKLKTILELFGNKDYRITLNTNLSLADKYIETLKQYPNVEYHVNLSTLDRSKHEEIINRVFFERVMKCLETFKKNNLNVCLNIPVLKKINEKELVDFVNYCHEMGFKPRFLVLFPMNREQEQYFYDVEEIMDEIPDSKLLKKYSYGRYDVESSIGNYEIVKCLCISKECELCNETTYVHITPDLNLRMCMMTKEEYEVDFSSVDTVEKSFARVIRKDK